MSVAWVLGGGSGIGRGAAESLARRGDHVVVSGRREAELDAVVAAIREHGGSGSAIPVDVSVPEQIVRAAERISAEYGPVRTLVYSAGTNVRNRYWKDTTPEDFSRVVDVNLDGAMRAAHAVIPGMIEARDGLVVLVSSWAGWKFAPAVGAAYSTSKTALGALADTINEQLRGDGVRATHFCPGEVATEILYTRPVVPTQDEIDLMLQPEDVGDAISWIASLPPRICVNEIVFTPPGNH